MVAKYDDKYVKGRRPNGIYIPRFRNVDKKTKMKTYATLNPSLSVHPVYLIKDASIQEYLRTVFSRCRLS